MKLMDGQLLYHGSYSAVKAVDLAKCAKGKDFGCGFYMTTDREQARSFIPQSIRKAKALGRIPQEQTYGYLSIFRYHQIKPIRQYVFETTDAKWLQFVAGNRLGSFEAFSARENMLAIASSDMIGGKIADDNTNRQLAAYIDGVFGALDDEEAIRLAVRRLKPENLKDQWCFLTEAALRCLTFVEADRYDF